MRRFRLAVLAAAVVGVAAATTAPGAEAAKDPVVLNDMPVTAMELGVGFAANSPQIAAHPDNPAFLVMANRVDGPNPGCDIEVSGDAGRLWAPINPVAAPPEGVSACYGPEVGFDAAGRLYYLFVGLKVPGNSPVGVYLVTSGDGGRHFSEPKKVLGASNYQVRMAVDPERAGRVWLVWLAVSTEAPLGGFPGGPNPILAARSDDAGASFSSPVQVSDSGRPRSVAPTVAVGADHELVVSYFDLGDDARDYSGLEGPAYEGPWSVLVSRSRRGGTSFSAPAVVSDDVVPPGRPPLIYTMAGPALALAHRERAYVGWSDARDGHPRVRVARSHDGGAHWEPSVGVGGLATQHQHLPALSVASTGRVDVVLFDRQPPPAKRQRVVYSFSEDNARSFAAPRALSTATSNPYIGQRWLVPSAKGQAELGSRLALYSKPQGALAAWPDSRNTFGDAGPEGGPIAHAVFSARVRFPAKTGRSVWPLATAVAAGVGLVVIARARRRHRARPAASPGGSTGSGETTQ